ncbi:MAG: GAF domain-containing sensor histidine kinase [Anaerolineae bacterium]|nr:GAF domain-containing sensor histidine kinase [Anaerolineae bacterium]
MQAITSFFQHNIIVVYFFYGLAFFCLGLIVWLETGRASTLRLARALGFLAAFGILHGLHEWFEMFQRLGAAGATDIPSWLLSDELRLGHLVLSFICLVIFGVQLIFATRQNHSRERLLAYMVAGTLTAVWLITVLITQWLYQPAREELLTAVDVLARYTLAIPGAVLAAWAIVLEQRTFRANDLHETSRDLLRAALALVLYGLVGQIFTAPSFFFPANIVNTELFLQWFGIPVQLFRAIMAALVAFFVIRALRAFETERQRNLARANEERLAAQRQALTVQEQSRQEMELLNQELQTAVQDLTLLFTLSRTLAASLDKKTLLAQAISQISASLPRFARGIIVLRQNPGRPLECAACPGHPDCQTNQPCVQARAITREIEATAVPVFTQNGDLTPLPQNTPPQDDTILAVNGDSAIGWPLSVQDQVIGSLVLHIQPEVTALTGRDLSLLSTVAGLLSIAIENATRYEESQAREALRGELLHQVVSVQERERQRIARDLHDGAGQALTALGLGFAAVSETVKSNPTLAAQQLVELKEMSTQALVDLRDLIRDLRPSLLDDLGLVPALQNQVQTFQAHSGVNARFTVHGRARRLPPDIETIVFRIAQEALTNITKHAAAENVAVTLTFAPEMVQLHIQDDGRGFPTDEVFAAAHPRRAWGLLGIQERVALVGGSCHISSTPGQGTAVDVTIPLPEEGNRLSVNGNRSSVDPSPITDHRLPITS